MEELNDIENLANPFPAAQDNFEQLDERVWQRFPSRVDGEYTEIIGPPTTGTFTTGKIWWDALLSLWICRAGGTPGTWSQFEPAVIDREEDLPAAPAAGYRVLRTDLSGREFYYNAGGDVWVDLTPPKKYSATYDIPNGVSQVVIASLGLEFIPARVRLQLLKPADGLNIFATVIVSTITADGFTADLSGATDSGNYKLDYELSE